MMPTPKKTPTATPKARARKSHHLDVEEVAPQLAGGPSQPAPAIPPSPCFLYVFDPRRWDVMEGQVVPVLSTIPFKAGVGGVDIDNHGKADIGTAMAEAAKRGKTVIPHAVDGPGTSYVRRIRSTGGWISRWETQFAGSTERRVDSKGYAEWLRSLIDRGVLPAPTPHVLAALAERLQQRIDTYKKSGKDGYASKIEATQRDLEVVLAEIKAVEAEEAEFDEVAPDVGA